MAVQAAHDLAEHALWTVGPPPRLIASIPTAAQHTARADVIRAAAWWYTRGRATLSWAYMYIILRALAIVSHDNSWRPHGAALGYDGEDSYVQLVALDFVIRGISPATVHLMDWDIPSHLTTPWQEWLLVPHSMEQARFASAGEPRVAAFAVDGLPPAGADDDHRRDVAAAFGDFYNWACSQ